jgi:hypothetical protein
MAINTGINASKAVSYAVLINPQVGVSKAVAYAVLAPGGPGQRGNIDFDQLGLDARDNATGTKVAMRDATGASGYLPMYSADGKTLTNSGVAAPSGAAATISAIQQEAYVYAPDSGSANAFAVTLTPAPAIVAGSEVVFKAASGNSTACTLTVNGTTYPLTKNGTTALVAGDIAAGQIITAKFDGTNFQIIVPGSGGGGTVTSVGLTVPSWLSVSGSPVTGSGTFAITATTGQTANQFLATPDGSTGAVGLRAIVAADLPAISLTAGVSGVLPVANGGTGQATFPLSVQFAMGSGATGTDVGPELLAHAGVITACKVRVKTSDASTALTFRIKQNGTSIFSSDQTISAGTSAGTTVDLTSALSSTSISVALDDVFTIDITSGTSSWVFTAVARG